MAEHAQAEFLVLADPTTDTTSRYGLFDLLGDSVSAPATLIIDRDRRVVAASIGENIGDRVSPETILRVLRELRGDGA
jgi:peroxiredoxin